MGGRPERFRQPTPAMQLKAVMGSLEGHFSNWQEGVISNGRIESVFEQHMTDVRELYEHLERGKWPPDPTAPKPPIGGGHL